MLFLPEATITFFIISTLLLGVSLPLQQRGTFSLAMTLVMTFFVICELLLRCCDISFLNMEAVLEDYVLAVYI